MNGWQKKSLHGILALAVTLGLTQVQAQRTTLTLAVVTTLSGDLAAVGEDTANGAQLCFEQYRNELRIPGVTLGLRLFDDRGNENGARETGAQVLADPNIFAVVGYTVSPNALIVMDSFEKAGLAYGVVGTSKRLTESGAKGVNRFVTRDDFIVTATAQYLVNMLSATSVLLVHDNGQNGISKAKEMAEELKKRNVAIAGILGTDKEADLPELVKQVKATNAQVVFYSGTLAMGGPLAVAFDNGKVSSKLIGTNTLDSAGFFQAAGKSAAGVEYASVGVAARLYPDGKAFGRRFKAKYGKEGGYRSAAACDATRAVMLALKSSMADGAPYSRLAVQTALRASNFSGITGLVKFDAKGDRTKQTAYIFRVGNDLIPRVVTSSSN